MGSEMCIRDRNGVDTLWSEFAGMMAMAAAAATAAAAASGRVALVDPVLAVRGADLLARPGCTGADWTRMDGDAKSTGCPDPWTGLHPRRYRPWRWKATTTCTQRCAPMQEIGPSEASAHAQPTLSPRSAPPPPTFELAATGTWEVHHATTVAREREKCALTEEWWYIHGCIHALSVAGGPQLCQSACSP